MEDFLTNVTASHSNDSRITQQSNPHREFPRTAHSGTSPVCSASFEPRESAIAPVHGKIRQNHRLWNELILMAYISCEFSHKVSTWFTDTLKNRLAIKYLCGHSNNVLWNHYCLWEAMFVAFVGNPCICIYFSTNVYSNTCWVFLFFTK